jgi:hypothetical protein
MIAVRLLRGVMPEALGSSAFLRLLSVTVEPLKFTEAADSDPPSLARAEALAPNPTLIRPLSVRSPRCAAATIRFAISC